MKKVNIANVRLLLLLFLIFFSFREVLIIDVVLVIILLEISNMLLLEHHVYSSVLALAIEDVAVVRILIYSVDKVEWVYDFVVKVELEVCWTKSELFIYSSEII